MKDLEALMPQYKKDVKVGLSYTVIAYSVVGCEKGLDAITEIAEMKSCTYSIFFEVCIVIESNSSDTKACRCVHVDQSHSRRPFCSLPPA